MLCPKATLATTVEQLWVPLSLTVNDPQHSTTAAKASSTAFTEKCYCRRKGDSEHQIIMIHTKSSTTSLYIHMFRKKKRTQLLKLKRHRTGSASLVLSSLGSL
jgi:hypothetical protein